MRTISLIPSYNPHNEYVSIVIEELNKFSDVILFTTEKHNLKVSETIYFNKSDIEQMIQHGRFESTFAQHGFQYGNCDQLESAASTLYFNYIKVFPYNFEEVECLHLPKKYIYFVDDNPTVETLKSIL